MDDCCAKKCKEKLLRTKNFSLRTVQKERIAYQNKNEAEKRQWVLDFVTHSRKSFSVTKYHYNGVTICRTAWMDLYGVTDRKLRGALDTYRSGGTMAAPHGNTSSLHRYESTFQSLGLSLSVIEQHCDASDNKVLISKFFCSLRLIFF